MPLTRNQSNAASQAKLAAAASASNTAETSSASKETNEQGPSAEAEPPRRDSPENCSICLGPFNNKSFTSSCAHSFCFVCLKQWSKVKAECPLCKQPFTSIFHNIRSNQHYDIYELPHQPPNPVDYNSIFNYVGGPITSFTGPTTHHLFSLPQPFDADLTLSNFSRFQFRHHRRYDRYLNPLSLHGEHPYSFTGGPAINPSSHVSATTWPRGPEEFRRDVYRRNLGPPASILGCENSTYRLTPAMVAASAHRIHRIMPWLTRELRVLLRSHQNVRLAISIIQPLLTQVTINSMFFYEKIAALIGRRARQFVQEFVAFANSALSLHAYDRKAMYRRRDVPAVPSSSSSSSGSENDVVEVTDISPDEGFPNQSAPGPSQTQPLNLSRTGWDSPTPGPSWDSALPVAQDAAVDRVSVSSESDDPVFRPDLLRDSDSDESKAGSDIIFVKYDKPWNERSPIKLTSDSDIEEGNGSGRKKKKSKHKKRKKENAENGEVSGTKKERGKKSSSKSKHREKTKSSSRPVAASDEEREAVDGKRRHSQSSTDHHKGKRHKKSKSKKEKPLSDREIVDRYFAKAISQDRDDNSSDSENELDSSVSAARRHNKERSSSKEKSKKKKKSRKHSKDSRTQSSSRHTYKKHHSGHKKSSNRLADGLQEQHQQQHVSRHAEPMMRQNQVGGPSRSETLGSDSLNQQHDTPGSSMSHSVVPGFQPPPPPPYLGMTDTVQHIPVNLWVSAWPTLSVAHTYPPPHPPPIAVGPTIPQQGSNTSSSTVTSNPVGGNNNAEPPAPNNTRTHLDRLSISSDSSSDSSDSDTEDDDDDAQDLQIPSLQNVHSRTKQWLETNFPDLGRPQTSTLASNVSNDAAMGTATAAGPVSSGNGRAATSSSTALMISSQNLLLDRPEVTGRREVEACGRRDQEEEVEEEDFVEVVSIGSEEDEDIVVCSSEDNASNAGDLWVIGVDHSNRKSNYNRNNDSSISFGKSTGGGDLLSSGGACHISTFPFPTIDDVDVVATTGSATGASASSSSGPGNIILPPANKPFQPFKLQRKPAMAVCGKDPFFPPMAHSSDEDGEVNNILGHNSGPSSHNARTSHHINQTVGNTTNTNTSGELSNIHNNNNHHHYDLIASSPTLSSSVPASLANINILHHTKDFSMHSSSSPQQQQSTTKSASSLPGNNISHVPISMGLLTHTTATSKTTATSSSAVATAAPSSSILSGLSTLTTTTTTTTTSSSSSSSSTFSNSHSSSSVKPSKSSSISYLPYANLPPPHSTSVTAPSILPNNTPQQQQQSTSTTTTPIPLYRLPSSPPFQPRLPPLIPTTTPTSSAHSFTNHHPVFPSSSSSSCSLYPSHNPPASSTTGTDFIFSLDDGDSDNNSSRNRDSSTNTNSNTNSTHHQLPVLPSSSSPQEVDDDGSYWGPAVVAVVEQACYQPVCDTVSPTFTETTTTHQNRDSSERINSVSGGDQIHNSSSERQCDDKDAASPMDTASVLEDEEASHNSHQYPHVLNNNNNEVLLPVPGLVGEHKGNEHEIGGKESDLPDEYGKRGDMETMASTAVMNSNSNSFTPSLEVEENKLVTDCHPLLPQGDGFKCAAIRSLVASPEENGGGVCQKLRSESNVSPSKLHKQWVVLPTNNFNNKPFYSSTTNASMGGGAFPVDPTSNDNKPLYSCNNNAIINISGGNLPLDSTENVNDKPFYDMYNARSVVGGDSVNDDLPNEKPFYSHNSISISTGNNNNNNSVMSEGVGVVVDSSIREKPFDALDDSMSDDVPVVGMLGSLGQQSPSSSSPLLGSPISLPSPPTPIRGEPAVSAAVVMPSIPASGRRRLELEPNQSVPPGPTMPSYSPLLTSFHPHKPHTHTAIGCGGQAGNPHTSSSALSMFKPYSDSNSSSSSSSSGGHGQSLSIQSFTDALASSDSDNEK